MKVQNLDQKKLSPDLRRRVLEQMGDTEGIHIESIKTKESQTDFKPTPIIYPVQVPADYSGL